MSQPPPPSVRSIRGVRRDDLDALRGFAMLHGIVLHASLDSFPFPSSVLVSPQSKAFALDRAQQPRSLKGFIGSRMIPLT